MRRLARDETPFLSTMQLRVIALAWCPDNDSVTHRHLVEMRRLARDETPFLYAMQLRVTALVW